MLSCLWWGSSWWWLRRLGGTRRRVGRDCRGRGAARHRGRCGGLGGVSRGSDVVAGCPGGGDVCGGWPVPSLGKS